MFTFHEFVAPVIRAMAGLGPERRATVEARLPVRIASERGRTEYVMVSLLPIADGLAAYPLGKGSGAITAFAQADGFVTVPRYAERLEADAVVEVTLLGPSVEPADLVVVGSHCVGLDIVIGALTARGLRVKVLNVGSLGGLGAARRGECDLAPIHLLDPATGAYNTPFLDDGLDLIPGYRRLQGLVYRAGDARLAGREPTAAVAAALADPDCVLINRNAGSGTRVLIDRLVGAARPPGWWVQAKSHNAVAAAVLQGRADWGVAIETVARDYRLGFTALQDERYDFAVPKARRDRAPVRAFVAALADRGVRAALALRGLRTA
jgi:putative molybdopterin biosynthesis protein